MPGMFQQVLKSKHGPSLRIENGTANSRVFNECVAYVIDIQQKLSFFAGTSLRRGRQPQNVLKQASSYGKGFGVYFFSISNP